MAIYFILVTTEYGVKKDVIIVEQSIKNIRQIRDKYDPNKKIKIKKYELSVFDKYLDIATTIYEFMQKILGIFIMFGVIFYILGNIDVDAVKVNFGKCLV